MTTRSEARELGEKFYQGQPCKHGHDGFRHTKSNDCVICAQERVKLAKAKARATISQRVIAREKAMALPQARLRQADVVPLLLPLVELKSNQCKYPYGERDNYTFCALTKMSSNPYCQPHMDLTHTSSSLRALERLEALN